jgi:putative component of membrane protein insertase Oxa1/YidC/SpoIIIJ protein YidD
MMGLVVGLRSTPARTAIVAIGLYQRHLSPRKGFRCAHRVLHGGESCSQHARARIASDGLIAGLSALRARLLSCREASVTLRSRLAPTAASREVQGEQGRDDEEATTPSRHPARCDPGCACDLGEFVSCDAPLSGMGDACVGSGCDGALDCGGAGCM